MFVAKRSKHNPVFTPDKNSYWEGFATFNLSPIKVGRTIYGFYRAISVPDVLRTPQQISIIGKCESRDGAHFKNRVPFIAPEEEWERFGCEDPRATFFEGKYYIFYTALSRYPFEAEGIKVAVAISKDLKKVDERHLVTPFNAKAMALFPERINGKVTVIFSAHTDTKSKAGEERVPAKIAIAQADRIEEFWSQEFWQNWYKEIDSHTLDPRRTDTDHVEVGAVPIKTKYGWLFVYSHIQNYFQNQDQKENKPRIFGIETLVLDLEDPKKIIGRTERPLLVPEEIYELTGYIPNIVFPTGALQKEDVLVVYYGAADTSVCSFSVSLHDLVHSILPDHKERHQFKRSPKNPIISPKPENSWESKATFNPGAIHLKGNTHLIYRAFSEDNTSTFGYAKSKNGEDITERLNEPVYLPREDFEIKKIKNANSGCEDARLTKIGKNIFMCYTAYDGVGPPRVAITSITEKNFLEHKWEWSKPILVTPPGFDDKDACLFPTKFKSGYLIFHRVNSEICGDYLPTLDFAANPVKKCIRVIGTRAGTWDSWKVGITAPPIKTKYGWLLLYHGVSEHTYRVGALLLDKKDPTIVLARSTDPIFEPVEEYEKVGVVNNVVFPCGAILQAGTVYIYYGGADKFVGVATMKLDVIVNALRKSRKF
ncbi:MAG: hypothetical protein M3M85_04355 [bacterium]|nr:hypothetical protein [bacterium]